MEAIPMLLHKKRYVKSLVAKGLSAYFNSDVGNVPTLISVYTWYMLSYIRASSV